MVWKSNATTIIEAKVVVKAEASLLCSSAFPGSVDGVVVLLVVDDDDFDEDDDAGVDDFVVVAAVSPDDEPEDESDEEPDDEDDSPGAASPSVEEPFTIANHLPKFKIISLKISKFEKL
jgi:hypothetical protein